MDEFYKTVGRKIAVGLDALAEAVTARHYESRPELTARYGEAGRAKCVQDARYHLTYLSEAIAVSSPALFADYVLWVKAMLAGRGIPASDLEHNLTCLLEVLRAQLPPEMSALAAGYVEASLKRLSQPPADFAPLLNEPGPHAGLARQYLELLLRGERHRASRLVLEAVESGVGVKEIYLHVFQRAQREVGRLWQMNRINVAQEHYCTAATQLIMSQLYPRIFRTEKNGRTLVATSVSGELHEIGVRMVADFFEMEGWDTYYVGANAPTPSLLQTLIERKAHVLGISATMTFHVGAVEALIAAVRGAEECRGVKIMVGGLPFALEPELWRRVGADFYAADAPSAVEAARRLWPG